MTPSVSIACSVTEHVSLAHHENAVPVLREVVVANGGDDDLVEVTLAIGSRPAVLRPLTVRLDRIAAGAGHTVVLPEIRLDGGLLAGFTEASRLDLTLTLSDAGGPVAEHVVPIRLLPPSHWGGGRSAPELLAAFVRPNDPAVDRVLREAAAKLAQAGRATAFEGYRGGRKSRVWEMAEAIWAALCDRGIAYVLPPASFEETGQKVRGPSDVLERRVGTCLDLSLLYAACLEQAGLHPVLVLTTGHALVGLWLEAADAPSALIDDIQILRKRRDLDELILVESTLLTGEPPGPFAAAVAQGGAQADENAARALDVALDIRRCRLRGIRPIDLGGAAPAGPAPAPAAARRQALSEPPRFRDDGTSSPEPADLALDRLGQWKRRLLDLTLRNKLLNFNPGKLAVTVDGAAAAALEDRLSAGRSFRLMPRSDVLGGSDARRPDAEGRAAHLADALARDEIHTILTRDDLDQRLLRLYRLARNGFEEGGANILFLSVGFLSWTRKPGEAAVRAPLLLVPVSLSRSSVRAGFRLALHDDEIRFNPTLIELLRQDFRLRLPELEGDLPRDEAGIDVERIFRVVRGHVRDLDGWEVVPDVVLSAFSFTKYLMWKDLVERADLLKRNPVVRHLLDTPKHAYGDGAPFPDPARLDVDFPPRSVFTPLSADSSQLAAVLAAAGGEGRPGKDFVLFGPPGTGKSQTIGNMIAQCLAQGRTVLFVSQKTAALEVVHRRLEEIGLGPCCLQIHSTKAQKSSVLAQLKVAWEARAAAMDATWIEANAELSGLRDELNGLVAALHGRRENGLSAYEAFGGVIAAGGGPAPFALAWPDHRGHSPETLAALRRACRDLAPVLDAVGDLADHPLSGIEAVEWSPRWRDEIAAGIADFTASLTAFGTAATAFAHAIGLPALVETHAGSRGLTVLGSYLTKPEAPLGAAFLSDRGPDLRRAVAARARHERIGAELSARLTGRYRPGLLERDPSALLAEWIAAQGAGLLFRGARLRKVRARIAPFAEGQAPDDLGPDLATLVDLSRHVRAGCPADAALGSLDPPWGDPTIPAASFEPALAWADRLGPAIDVLGPLAGGREALRGHVLGLVAREAARFCEGGTEAPAYRAFERERLRLARATKALGELAGRPDPAAPLATGRGWIEESLRRAEGWAENLGKAPGWCGWRAAASEADILGLAPVVAALEDGQLAPEAVAAAFEAAYARWWIDRVVSDDRRLSRFLPERHEDAIARFRAADERVGELAKRVVRARLGGGVPLPTAFGADPQWGTLAREIAKKTRHKPLRQLFGLMPDALTRLTPCVMMSPLSIAQYLPPDAKPFDVVIFDEASQIAPWDAVGAMARGTQVVVVGDPEQLPPTNVGDRGVDEIEDGADVADQESILDECLAANLPRMALAWHYRSRHESLIAFSNARYYGGALVTFPSPVTSDRAVRLVSVADGLYERGAGRVNRPEARAVVAEVVRRLRDPDFSTARSSLGIVTFNGEQQRLIENLLDAERRATPDLEPFFDRERWHEPVFVKNLENVQGDERDAILFSVAVGPDQGGRVSSTVSSLNKDGGHRRLNVAITRARRELVVFASLTPAQIDLGRTSARGVRDFKHFLDYAARGPRALAEAFAATGGDVESPFESAVMAGLAAHGWTVHPQIGVSGFRIDLGVVHPDAPGRYLAGIECDGASYHRSATARDRDRLRELVLTGLGWSIRRVWSTEWWRDPATALTRLDRSLRTDLDAERRAERERLALTVARETSINAPATIQAGPPAAMVPSLPPLPTAAPAPPALLYADSAVAAEPPASYRVADPDACGLALDPERFHDPAYGDTLAALVAHMLALEAPIFEDVMVRRISRAHGFTRTGTRIRDTVRDRIAPDHARSDEDGRTVVWPAGEAPRDTILHRRCDPAQRNHADTPLCELAGLAKHLAPRGGDLVRRMASDLGIVRIEAATRVRLEAAVRLAGVV